MTHTISPATPAKFYPWAYVENGRWYHSDKTSAYGRWIWQILCWTCGAVFILGLCAFHPIIGIIVGLLCAYGMKFKRYGTWNGNCPHCGHEIAFAAGSTVGNCPICTRRIYIANGTFEAV